MRASAFPSRYRLAPFAQVPIRSLKRPFLEESCPPPQMALGPIMFVGLSVYTTQASCRRCRPREEHWRQGRRGDFGQCAACCKSVVLVLPRAMPQCLTRYWYARAARFCPPSCSPCMLLLPIAPPIRVAGSARLWPPSVFNLGQTAMHSSSAEMRMLPTIGCLFAVAACNISVLLAYALLIIPNNNPLRPPRTRTHAHARTHARTHASTQARSHARTLTLTLTLPLSHTHA